MTAKQLLKLLSENRELLHRNNAYAYDHLLMMNKDYAHLQDEEVILNMELNNSIAEVQFNSRHDIAIENSLRMLAKYDNSAHQYAVIRHYCVLGGCYANTGEFEKAEQYLLSALKKITSYNPEFITLKTDILHVLTMNEQLAGRGPEKSVQYLTEALALLPEDSFPIHRANCLMGLGNVYLNTDNFVLALENYLAAADTFEMKYDLANLGCVYSNLGNCYALMNDDDKAEKYHEKSLEVRMKVGSPDNLSISYFNLAIFYKEKNKLDLAEELLLKCKGILLRTDSKPFLKDTEDQLAEIAVLKAKGTASV